MNIDLSGAEISSPNTTTTPGWWVDRERVNVRTRDSLSTFNLPKHSKRTVLYRHGNGRSQLVLGGFKTATVTITGPAATIESLREAVL